MNNQEEKYLKRKESTLWLKKITYTKYEILTASLQPLQVHYDEAQEKQINKIEPENWNKKCRLVADMSYLPNFFLTKESLEIFI